MKYLINYKYNVEHEDGSKHWNEYDIFVNDISDIYAIKNQIWKVLEVNPHSIDLVITNIQKIESEGNETIVQELRDNQEKAINFIKDFETTKRENIILNDFVCQYESATNKKKIVIEYFII